MIRGGVWRGCVQLDVGGVRAFARRRLQPDFAARWHTRVSQSPGRHLQLRLQVRAAPSVVFV